MDVWCSNVTGQDCMQICCILKGIVSRVWEQLQWNPSDRSEVFRIAGAYFYSLLTPFSCFNSKKAFCGGFSFDSNSANDEQQPEITLRMMSNSCRSAPVIITHLPIDQAVRRYCYDRRNWSSKLHTYWRMNRTGITPIEENDLRLLLIICKVTFKWETAKACFFRNKTWKFRQKELKICFCEGKSNDLSNKIISVHSQSRDTIPLMIILITLNSICITLIVVYCSLFASYIMC